MAPIKHTYNTPLDADYSVICIDDFQFNNNVGKSLDFETRYIEDKDQTECVWVFFNFHCSLSSSRSRKFVFYRS